MVTTVTKIAVKMIFASFGFNLFQLLTQRNKELYSDSYLIKL
jgi:hypothetical protein